MDRIQTLQPSDFSIWGNLPYGLRQDRQRREPMIAPDP